MGLVSCANEQDLQHIIPDRFWNGLSKLVNWIRSKINGFSKENDKTADYSCERCWWHVLTLRSMRGNRQLPFCASIYRWIDRPTAWFNQSISCLAPSVLTDQWQLMVQARQGRHTWYGWTSIGRTLYRTLSSFISRQTTQLTGCMLQTIGLAEMFELCSRKYAVVVLSCTWLNLNVAAVNQCNVIYRFSNFEASSWLTDFAATKNVTLCQ